MPVEVYSWFDRVCGALLPPRCVLCGGRGQWPDLDLCGACQDDLPVHACVGLDGDLPPCDRWFAAFEYAAPVDFLVQTLKYRGQLATGRVLGALLGTAVVRHGFHLDVDVVVPVPLHPLRHAERGFNQSAELGRWVARAAGRRFLERAATRIRDTRHQVGLRLEERRANLEGAFTCTSSFGGLRVAIVDDVLTTGSTARAMAGALRAADAASIDFWCVARALPSDSPGFPGGPPGSDDPRNS